ncbi:MAG: hypothetical protein QE267_06965 [Akkermansiaceae bacterium]|nr:hypothetical protein [Akkermansiaceae bacterium]
MAGTLQNISTSGVGSSLVQFDVSPTANATLDGGTGDFTGVAAGVSSLAAIAKLGSSEHSRAGP